MEISEDCIECMHAGALPPLPPATSKASSYTIRVGSEDATLGPSDVVTAWVPEGMGQKRRAVAVGYEQVTTLIALLTEARRIIDERETLATA